MCQVCQPIERQHEQGCQCGCCGCGCGTSFRRFISVDEQLERLEVYKEQLKKELAGAENRIKELQGK